ncbi:hypothetical protein ACIGEP_03015 [Microbacterium sp. NPDC077663]|uniref:hypothetical protein n=1 Tax=Microbacterium sp. NPDC077663 TaxID=3364189 RepID=UPI0037C809B3
MTDPLDDQTHRVPRTRRDLRADREDVTRIVARRTAAPVGPAAAGEDETVIADRHTDDPTRGTARRVTPRVTTGGTAIAHGRADTPRTASAPGTLVSHPVYGPRRTQTGPSVVRTEIAPPAAAAPAAPRRSHGGVLLLVALAGTAIVAAAVWGIIVIVQGGIG